MNKFILAAILGSAITFGAITTIFVISGIAGVDIPSKLARQQTINMDKIIPSRDYQIELGLDSVFVYDGHRYVGSISLWSPDNGNKPQALDSLIIIDNY